MLMGCKYCRIGSLSNTYENRKDRELKHDIGGKHAVCRNIQFSIQEPYAKRFQQDHYSHRYHQVHIKGCGKCPFYQYVILFTKI